VTPMSTLAIIQQLLTKEFDLSPDRVAPDAPLADLGIDSLATIEFMFLVEEKFKLELSGEPVAVKTVGDIVREVDGLIAKKGAQAA
jgi:acyl carrier protein